MAAPDGLVIRPCLPHERWAVRDLFLEAFSRRGASGWGLPEGVIRIAERDADVVGFLALQEGGVGDLRLLEPPERGVLEGLGALDDAAVRYLGPPGPPWPTAHALSIGAIAVAPRLRRQGIGLALLRESCAIADRAGCAALYAHCIIGSGSPELFVEAGFERLLAWRRFYRDGSGAVFVGRRAPGPRALTPTRSWRAASS